MLNSVSVVMSEQNIGHVGDCEELEKSCKNVQELDLSKNEFDDWNEVFFFYLVAINSSK